MKNLSSSHSLAILLMALSVTVLMMIPLITGAAPTADPPDGLITPTFSGLNINDGTDNNLNISSTGDMSNPSSGPVTIRDNDGVIVSTVAGQGSMGFVPNQTQSYLQNQGLINLSLIGQSILVRDSQGLGIVDDTGANFAFGVIPLQTSGSPERGIYANTSIINSGTENGGAVTINDNLDLAGWLSTSDKEITPTFTATDCANDGGVFYVPPMGSPICLMPVRVNGSLKAGELRADSAMVDNGITATWLGTTGPITSGDIVSSGTIEATGKITSDGGFGTIRTYSATSGSIANGATGIVTRGCDAGVLISCGHDAGNNWNVFDSYRDFNIFATPRTRCYAQARNSTGAAGTFSVVAVCQDATT